MGLFDAIASTVGSLTDNVLGMVNQNHQDKVNLRMMREQNSFNAEQAQFQRDWQERMWGMNNAYNSPDAFPVVVVEAVFPVVVVEGTFPVVVVEDAFLVVVS